MSEILPVNQRQIRQADHFRRQFEDFLRQVVEVSNDMVRSAVLDSGELFTDFTGKAEKATSELTGIPIDTRITLQERMLRGSVRQKDALHGSILEPDHDGARSVYPWAFRSFRGGFD